MSDLSQVWKRLGTYVRGSWVHQKSNQGSHKGKVGLTSRKNWNGRGQKYESSSKNVQQLLMNEQLYSALMEWGQCSEQNAWLVDDIACYTEIYNLLGERVLKAEVTQEVIERLSGSNKFHPIGLFERLSYFYSRWCQGEFIDALPEVNFPQKKMLDIRAKKVQVGLRQVDIYTGLNVLILLLELSRYAQQSQELKPKIIFYPSGQPDTNNFFTSQLLRVINYSDSIEVGNFASTVGEFLYGCNFSGAYLGDVNLTGVNFAGANLTGTYLGNANFTGTNFSNANLSVANLGDANLSGANLSGAMLRRADLSSANLSGANLVGANLVGADLSYADLSSSDLSGANLTGANLTGANLRDAVINNAILKRGTCFGANLSGASLQGANLSQADLCRADVSGVNLQSTNLIGINLSDSILFSANLENANMHAADLSYAKLHGAKLHGANLREAILLGADLNGVELGNVILREANLSGVTLSEADLQSADLSEAILCGTDLSFANLNNANLSSSNLTNTIFSGADLSGANLSYAVLEETDFKNTNLEAITWNDNQSWEGAHGLETALNIPAQLKEKLGLRISSE
ncbi:MAG: pentapeptide repeat-containing protein [Calothrix sp. C42_A2020_038]|nr:pentapeptide repeat-containing protein [Calothrix sp. C42_A2020_038]